MKKSILFIFILSICFLMRPSFNYALQDNNKEIYNILLVGKDGISQKNSRSDTMIILTVDNKNKNLTQLSNIPMDSAIKEGDIILTSGLGSMYPKGIRIGEVTSVEVDNVGIMKKAVVKPYVDFNKLQELFVIVPKEKVDIGE